MCTLDVDAAGLCGGGGAPASGRRGPGPSGSSGFLCLQTVPRLSGPRPPVSPRRSPPPRGLGLEHPRRWAAPRTAARGPGPAGGKARPVLSPRPAPRSCAGRRVALPGPGRGGQVQLCSRREDSRARVIEQLCYGCRANMKDVVSGSRPRVVTGEVHPRGSVPHGPSPTAVLSVAALLGPPATLHLGRGPAPQPKVPASHTAGGAPFVCVCVVGGAGRVLLGLCTWRQVPSVWLPPGPRRRSRSIWWRTALRRRTPPRAEPGATKSRGRGSHK